MNYSKFKKASGSLGQHTSNHSHNGSEALYRSLLLQANNLKIITPEVQKLRQHIEEVDSWQRRVNMFLEDYREQEGDRYKEIF